MQNVLEEIREVTGSYNDHLNRVTKSIFDKFLLWCFLFC